THPGQDIELVDGEHDLQRLAEAGGPGHGEELFGVVALIDVRCRYRGQGLTVIDAHLARGAAEVLDLGSVDGSARALRFVRVSARSLRLGVSGVLSHCTMLRQLGDEVTDLSVNGTRQRGSGNRPQPDPSAEPAAPN